MAAIAAKAVRRAVDRPYDVVLLGATGFTGKLALEYLVEAYVSKGSPLKFAIAGRNVEKLREVRDSIKGAEELPMLQCSTEDQKSIDDVVATTKVIITTAGPFEKHGTPVVDACVRLGADYADITGEAPWVRKMIDRYDEAAVKRGVLIVPSCGFDSIPADMGSFMVVDYVKNKLNDKVTDIDSYVQIKGGGPSGGTLSSLFNALDKPRSEVLKMLNDYYALNPADKPKPEPKPHDAPQKFIAYSRDVKGYTLPFFMQVPNSRVVRRSAALLDYGKDFSYNECLRVGSIFNAVIGYFLMILVFALLSVSAFRNFAKRFLPKPGEGPSAEQRANTRMTYTLIAKTAGGKKVRGVVAGKDLGYTETGKMLVEAGIALAERDKTPIAGDAGVRTTASGIGQPLIRRITQAGIKFEVESMQ